MPVRHTGSNSPEYTAIVRVIVRKVRFYAKNADRARHFRSLGVAAGQVRSVVT